MRENRKPILFIELHFLILNLILNHTDWIFQIFLALNSIQNITIELKIENNEHLMSPSNSLVINNFLTIKTSRAISQNSYRFCRLPQWVKKSYFTLFHLQKCILFQNMCDLMKKK
ncbi:hypothetical protein BpHYR1_021223 [Brachionus plicatilis]|uniref:Uncharacterized protein n=1 Tax=Brachionus plicatilis TaxID=10195 RepID=A0A3M7T2N6_BRAPC|nr:hypothetical protein BpHYR1_021223 [Brachionus plicatilis]